MLSIPTSSVIELKAAIDRAAKTAGEKAGSGDNDPLFSGVPELSNLVSEIDSIKKRDANILEECLLTAINGCAGWQAKRIPEKFNVSKRALVAWCPEQQKMYGFLTRRGFGEYDASSIRDFNIKLREIDATLPNIEVDLDVECTKRTFMFSFYGKKWGTEYETRIVSDLSKMFNDDVRFFVEEFVRYNQEMIKNNYKKSLSEHPQQAVFELHDKNIFSNYTTSELSKWAYFEINEHLVSLK